MKNNKKRTNTSQNDSEIKTSQNTKNRTRSDVTKKSDSESGRSMTEMLGTLAIMGVLAIGGIVGYGYAIDKLETNEFANELNVRAMTISTQKLAGKTEDLSEFKSAGAYDISVNVYEPDADNFFTLDTTDVPLEICQNLINNPPQNIAGIYLNDVYTDSAADCGAKNDMVFVYHNALEHVKDMNTGDSACLLACPGGESLSPSCGENEQKQASGTKVCGKSCYVCKDDECPAGMTKSCETGYVGTKMTVTEAGSDCFSCKNDICPADTYQNQSCPSGYKQTSTSTTEAGSVCRVCKNDTCPADTYQNQSCPSGYKQTSSSTTEAGSTCRVCKNDTCSTDPTSTYKNQSCPSGYKQTSSSTTDAGSICRVCKDDTCPSGTAKSCSSGYTETYHSSTDYGTACYTCTQSGGDDIPTPGPMSPQN